MLMNADEFDDDFGDPRSMRSGIAGLDLESSGEAKESKSPLDRPSRGRHSRKKKMAPPSMAPPTMKPPSMAPPRDVYGESKEEEKSLLGVRTFMHARTFKHFQFKLETLLHSKREKHFYRERTKDTQKQTLTSSRMSNSSF